MFRIENATEKDKTEILNLYRSHLGGAAAWNENYPNEETIAFDLERNALFTMKNEKDEIIATISMDDDPEVEKLDCWNKELLPAGELSRLCVREDMQNQGIARMMMEHTFKIMKEQGMKMVHILVKTGHIVALRSYAHLGFVQVGSCRLFEKEFLCFEKCL